ncbi:MAG: hypothetical protein ABI325_07510 [Ginsengibacter sp.]
MVEQKNEMNSVSSILEKLHLKKCDNEFKITPQGFATGNSKNYHP